MERLLGLALNYLQDVSHVNELERHMPFLGGGLLPDAMASEGNQHLASCPSCSVAQTEPSQVTLHRPTQREGSGLTSHSRTGTHLGRRRKLAQEKDGDPRKVQESWQVSGSRSQPRASPQISAAPPGGAATWPHSTSLGSALESLY